MSDAPDPIPARWYQRSAFRAWWQATTGILGTALMGGMDWRSAGISIGVGTLTASGSIFFGETPGVAPK